MIRANNTLSSANSTEEIAPKTAERNAALKAYVKRVSDYYKSKSDWEILRIIRSALQGNVFLNANNILIKVEEGWVYLEGSVENEDQRNLAKKLIRDIFGVTRVTNYLTFPSRSIRKC